MSSGIVDAIRLMWHRSFFTEKQIRNYQNQELRKLVDLCRNQSPFYRDRLSGVSISNQEDLKKLKPMNKTVLMENFDTLNTAGIQLKDAMEVALSKELSHSYLGYYQDRYVLGLSSGTSGNKGLFLTDRKLTEKLPFVFLARGGIKLRQLPFRILFCLRVFSQGFADIRSPLIDLTYCATMTPPEEIIALLNQNRINILMAPPSLVRCLIPFHNQIRHPLKQIVCYAEVLEKEEKARFASIFSTSVIEIYQASEGQIASTCRYGNLHINEDLVLVELTDENGNDIHQPGQVCAHMYVTNLVNTVQPLLRYEMNDLIVLGEECPCKSKFRTIDRILGRNDDVLFFTVEGKKVPVFPDLFSRWIITTSDAIWEFCVQQDLDETLHITIDLLASDTQTKEEVIERLRNRIIDECSRWSIHPNLIIHNEKICLPADSSKQTRFIVSKAKSFPKGKLIEI